MEGQTVSHYQILKKLGAGGMGEVYLAEDSSLKRKVALKFLPEYLQQDHTARKRFLREAESAASIEHPFICNIKEVSQTDDGHDFIVMEYVEGQTLKEQLEKKPLSIRESVRIGAEISEALQLAHEKGIIHRDLKPSNIMLTPQGHAKVMDFGLAKRLGTADGGDQEITATLTREGSTLGTLAYMSPEQLKGVSVDHRSDIFSFGIVLYEMLTGSHPFRRGKPMETASAILMASPVPLKQMNQRIPDRLEQTVLRMLARNPADRYQSVSEVLSRLTDPRSRRKPIRWSVGSGFLGLLAGLLGRRRIPEEAVEERPKIESLAVLPLTNMSGDPSQDYFADGMTEALITDLAKIGALKVTSRSSTMAYKDTQKPLSRIARELKVQALVEGSVLREGDRVGITAQLIDAATGNHLWADRYEKSVTSILALQSEVAQAIARQIQVTLTPVEESLLKRTREVDPEAYETYLKGLFYWYKLSPADLETALQYFQMALNKDPDYALAHVGVSMVWGGRQQMGITPPQEANPKMREAVLQALELDDNLAEAHFMMALQQTWSDWDWEGGKESFLRALEINSNYADLRAYYSHYLMIMKKPGRAMDEMVRALELDPLNPLLQALYGALLHGSSRQHDEALKVLRMVPHHPIAQFFMIDIFHQKGMFEEAYQVSKEYYVIWFGDSKTTEILEQGYSKSGFAGAMAELAEMWERNSASQSIPCFDISAVCIFAGEKDRALNWLERGFEVRDSNMPYFGLMPTFDDLHDEPRFQDLLRRMNFPDDVLSAYLEN